MKMMTAQQAAEKWNTSVRNVQDLCKRGRISGAEHWGTAWMIPADAVRPPDGRRKEGKVTKDAADIYQPLIRKSPFLNMTNLYTVPGSAEKVIASLADYPEAQALFMTEIAYSRGEIDKVYEQAHYLLSEHTGFYAVNAGGMLLALAAMWKGDIHLYRRAKVHILEAPAKSETDRDIMALSLACIDSAVRNTANHPEWFQHGRFEYLHPDSHAAAKVFYVKYLLVRAQEMAKGAFKLPDVTGMGLMKSIPYIVEPLISRVVAEKLVIAEIYLRLLAAVAYHQIGDEASAIGHVDKAIALALPDGLLGILAEHRRQFGYLLDDRLELADPVACKKYKALHKGLLEGWTKLHNSLLSKSVLDTLSIRQREIARLAAFGYSNSGIAERLHISESAVKKAIYEAMNKAGVDKREELGAFV
ncbi:MAG: hypothetical protein E7438_07610 [Ruminococcaceae bacterium]|nr:hypothetical protein [Oscillospiraceae bacterium]